MINLLLTSVNWRAEIVRLFREKMKRLDRNNRVITTEVDPLATAIYASDKNYMVPRYTETGYLDALKKICSVEKINFIIPQTDRDCNYFAGHRDIIESWGARILMPSPEKVKILNNKKLCQEFLGKHGVLIPRNYAENEIDHIERYPLIVKPRRDSGSANVRTARDRNELASALKYVDSPIVEEFIEGDEFTADMAANLDHSIIGVVPRRRITVKGGVSIKGVTFYDRELIETARKVARLIEPTGFFCMQFIKRDNRYYLIEINARMGSGIVLSIRAGLDIGKIIAAYARGENIFFKDDFFKTDLYMMQYLKPYYRKKGQLR